LKLFPQILHLKSLRSLWTTEWSSNFVFLINLDPQMRHSNGLTPLWIFIWVLNPDFLFDFFPQIWHSNFLRSLWITEWIFKYFFDRNILLQIEHLNGRFTMVAFINCNFDMILNMISNLFDFEIYFATNIALEWSLSCFLACAWLLESENKIKTCY
jgi:hypothetical protein